MLLAQDPQSHHSIVEFYVPPRVCVGGDKEGDECDNADESFCGDGGVCALNRAHLDPMNEVWKNWQCLGGDRGQCATAPITTVACIFYANGPAAMGSPAGLFGRAEARLNLATAQEATFREDYPPNVFSLMPVKGFVIWDSHAFNLTKSDTSVEQWMNVEFAEAEEMVYPRVQTFDAGDLFRDGSHRCLFLQGSLHDVHGSAAWAVADAELAHPSLWQGVPRLVPAD